MPILYLLRTNRRNKASEIVNNFKYAWFVLNFSPFQGPYELVYNQYEVCKGPKTKDVAILQLRLQKNNKDEFIGFFNLTVKESCRLEEVSIQEHWGHLTLLAANQYPVTVR